MLLKSSEAVDGQSQHQSVRNAIAIVVRALQCCIDFSEVVKLPPGEFLLARLQRSLDQRPLFCVGPQDRLIPIKVSLRKHAHT